MHLSLCHPCKHKDYSSHAMMGMDLRHHKDGKTSNSKILPTLQAPLSKGSAALPELTDSLLARSGVTLHSFRGVCSMTVTHSNIQAILRSSTTLDIMQEDRSDLPKESAAELGAEPRATMLPGSTQLHREQQVNVIPPTDMP